VSGLSGLRDRFAVIPGSHRPKPVRNGAIGLLIVAVLCGFGAYYSFVGYWPLLPRGGTVIRADFPNAFDVNTDTPVRIGSVSVGRVDSVGLANGGRSALVSMRISDQATGMLHSDASAAVKERLILGGNMYIELTPGHDAAPLSGAIPLSRTTVQVNLDQLLNTFRPAVRAGLGQTFRGLRASMQHSAPVQGAVDALAPSFRELAPALSAVRGQQPGDLHRLIGGFGRIAGSLNQAEGSLGDLINSASTTFGVIAARGADLGTLLDRAPTALAVTSAQLAGLNHTIAVLNPLAHDLLPGAGHVQRTLLALEPALGDARVLLDRARPLLDALDPAVQNLHAAAAQGAPLIGSLTPTVNRVNNVLLPFLYSTDPQAKLRMYELPGPTVAAVDSLAGLFDSTSHVAAFDGGIGPQALHDYLPCQVYLNDPGSRHLVCEQVLQYLYSLFGGQAPSSSLVSSLAGLVLHR
jgi:virulence factor Mce-like protein